MKILDKINHLKVSTALALTLAFALTGCGVAGENINPTSQTEASQSQETRSRLDSKYTTNSPDVLNLQLDSNAQKDSYIKISDEGKISFKSIGFIEETPDGLIAAEGEKLFAINYQNDSTYPAEFTYEIDGTTKKFDDSETNVLSAGTVIISALESNNIILNVSTNNITQSVDFKTGERLSRDIAESWYLNDGIGKFKDTVVDSTLKSKAGKTLTTTDNYVEAIKTPFDSNADEGKGWADGGKKSWIIVTAKNTSFDFNADVDEMDRVSKTILTDTGGNTYVGKVDGGSLFSEEMTITFKVPSNVNEFDIHNEHSFNINSWGDTVDTVVNQKSKTTKLTFS